MALTPEQEKKYIEDGGSHCPYCGSTDVESGPLQADGNIAWAKVGCYACHKNWQDDYKLVGIQERE